MKKVYVDEYNVQDVIAELLMDYSGDTAYQRLVEDARFAKQSVAEVARRRAGNLITSFVTRKPGGEVIL